MSESKKVLVLHLSSGADPLVIAVSSEEADKLTAGLPKLVRDGEFHTLEAENGAQVTVNFAHVLAAHVDVLSGISGQLYGSQPRRTGL